MATENLGEQLSDEEAQALGEETRLAEEARVEGRKIIQDAKKLGVPEQQMGELTELLEDGDLTSACERFRSLASIYQPVEPEAVKSKGTMHDYLERTGKSVDDLTGREQIQLGIEEQGETVKMGGQKVTESTPSLANTNAVEKKDIKSLTNPNPVTFTESETSEDNPNPAIASQDKPEGGTISKPKWGMTASELIALGVKQQEEKKKNVKGD